MREKFFQKGSYLLRLDDIKPKQAKPAKRIHLNCSMALTEDEIPHAPTRIKRVWEIVANPQLDTFHVPISSQLKGIEIELYPSLPMPLPAEQAPLLVCIKNSILRDIRLDREKLDEKNWEVRLRFSLGITWDSAVWKWGEDYVFLECYAKFSQSQAELFDENDADSEIAPSPEVERLRAVEVEDLAKEITPTQPDSAPVAAIDPLLHDQAAPKRPGRTKKMRVWKGGPPDARPHA